MWRVQNILNGCVLTIFEARSLAILIVDGGIALHNVSLRTGNSLSNSSKAFGTSLFEVFKDQHFQY